ncbi:MAG: hypothetical protein IPK60_16855 [Sandaracinaceae bacterium]|nr:hypothetical protein [Sandaracinaceae bacterium]
MRRRTSRPIPHHASAYLGTIPFGAFCDCTWKTCAARPTHSARARPITDGCLDVWDPVCGCDGDLRHNTCYAFREGVASRSRRPSALRSRAGSAPAAVSHEWNP